MNALLSTPEIGPPLIQYAPFPAMADSHHPKPGAPQSQTSSTRPASTFAGIPLSVQMKGPLIPHDPLHNLVFRHAVADQGEVLDEVGRKRVGILPAQGLM